MWLSFMTILFTLVPLLMKGFFRGNQLYRNKSDPIILSRDHRMNVVSKNGSVSRELWVDWWWPGCSIFTQLCQVESPEFDSNLQGGESSVRSHSDLLEEPFYPWDVQFMQGNVWGLREVFDFKCVVPISSITFIVRNIDSSE